MEKKLTVEQIKERLKELDILETKEKIKLETLRNQKKSEIKENIDYNGWSLTQEEEKKLKETFKGKSIDETKKIIKNNKDPKTMNMVKKFWRAIGILAITSGLIRAIWTRAQKDAKNKRVYENEQGLDQKKNDNNTKEEVIIPPPAEKFTIEKLQQSIAQEKIQGIIYENVMDAVEKIATPKIKKQVIDLLKGGNIIGLQELYGMKRNSKYSSNKATGTLDKKTLNKIKNPLFGLMGQEVIENENIPNDVKEIYKEFIIGQIPNDDLAYLILSKKTCKQYLFDKNNQLIDIQPVLIGADLGNKGKFMPYEYYKVTGGKKIYVRGERNRNTPTGVFKVKKTIDLWANYKVDGPKRGINIVPIDLQWNEEERFKYKQWGLAIHPIYQPPTNPEKYENAIESWSTQDNSITHGCPNIEWFGIVFDQLAIWSKVYICTE